jgi:H+/Cl- antiporter ClcA
MLAMALLAVGAAVGFVLARLAERRFPDDDLVLIAHVVNLVTLVAAVPSTAALMFRL